MTTRGTAYHLSATHVASFYLHVFIHPCCMRDMCPFYVIFTASHQHFNSVFFIHTKKRYQTFSLITGNQGLFHWITHPSAALELKVYSATSTSTQSFPHCNKCTLYLSKRMTSSWYWSIPKLEIIKINLAIAGIFCQPH